jgi:predicted dehydrogenase
MKKITVAVIGLGYWGPNIIRNLLNVPHVSNVYVFDLQQVRISNIKKTFPNVIVSKDYSKILSLEEIDAVIIATPIETHFELAKKALIAKKHVLVEKPMTKSSKEAKKLISLSQKQNRTLMAGHTFVYSETIKKIKDVISKKELGKIYYYDSTRINLGLIQKESNVIWDLAPHDFSILNYIYSAKPLTVRAFGKSFIGNKNEEIAHIFVTYEGGITAHIHVSWLSPVKVRTILIGGSKKMIMFNDLEPSEKIRIYNKGVVIPASKITPFSPAYRSGDVIIPHIEQKEALFNELSHFVACIISNKTPITDGKAGLEVVKLLEASDLALKTNSVVSINK